MASLFKCLDDYFVVARQQPLVGGDFEFPVFESGPSATGGVAWHGPEVDDRSREGLAVECDGTKAK